MGAPQIAGTVRNSLQRLFSQLSHKHLEVRDVGCEPCVHSLSGGTVGRKNPLLRGKVLGWVSLQSLPQVLLSLVANTRGALVMATGSRVLLHGTQMGKRDENMSYTHLCQKAR